MQAVHQKCNLNLNTKKKKNKDKIKKDALGRSAVAERSRALFSLQIVDEEGRRFEPRRQLIQDVCFLLRIRLLRDCESGLLLSYETVNRDCKEGCKRSFESTFFELELAPSTMALRNYHLPEKLLELPSTIYVQYINMRNDKYRLWVARKEDSHYGGPT